MANTTTVLTWLLRDQVSGTAKQIDGNLSKLGLKTKQTGANMGLLAGTMLAAGAVAVGLVDKFANEEVGIASLGASLRANVKDWDGNTASIEKTIAMRENLAFSDDDLRESLKLLVGSTHDVKRAFDLQATAMDLARFKGIDLATASTALVKIEGGQFRALKELIGSTKDITTTEEALAAVRKVAAGQADAYADTTKGKLDRLKIGWEDLQEEAGGALMNIADGWAVVADRFNALAGTAQHPVEAMRIDLELLRKKGVEVEGSLPGAAAAIKGVGDAANAAEPPTGDMADAMMRVVDSALTKPDSAKILAWMNSVGLGALTLKGEALAAYRALRLLTGIDTTIVDNPNYNPKGGKDEHRASGGPVSAGGVYTVGENGPETLVMGGGSGTIVPNGGMGVQIQGVSAAQMADMIDRQLYFKLSRASKNAVRT